MSSSLRFYYGDFVHPKCEVYPSLIQLKPLHSQRGIRWGSQRIMQIGGDLVSTGTPLTPAEISARLIQLESAYRQDYKNCGFILDDGTATPHQLLTNDADNLSGNRVTMRSWDNVLPTEYANTRSFSVHIEAIYKEAYSEIIAFTERTHKVGNGGPAWRMHRTFNGLPIKEFISATTPVKHTTTGTVIAMSGFVLPPPPLWPLEEMEWLREVTYHSPKMYGHPSYKYAHYATQYTYHFWRPSADATTPYNTWYTAGSP